MRTPGLYEFEEIGRIANKRGEDFSVIIGLSEDLAKQLRRRSLDKEDIELMENTSDLDRFGYGSYEKWFENRTPFAVVTSHGELAAFAWFGPKPYGQKSMKHMSPGARAEEQVTDTNGWHTVSFRSYEPYRATGIMRPFMEKAMAAYKELHPDAKIWAIIDSKNASSIALSERLGFAIAPQEDQAFTLMTLA
jgi:hypothetical protein